MFERRVLSSERKNGLGSLLNYDLSRDVGSLISVFPLLKVGKNLWILGPAYTPFKYNINSLSDRNKRVTLQVDVYTK